MTGGTVAEIGQGGELRDIRRQAVPLDGSRNWKRPSFDSIARPRRPWKNRIKTWTFCKTKNIARIAA